MSPESARVAGSIESRELPMDAFSDLLRLPASEKVALGVTYTVAEIAQQPDSWLSTFQLFRQKRAQIAEFLSNAGIGGRAGSGPTVFLVGAGTSDYIGQSLASLLRKLWQCEVAAIPSTDLLTHMGDLMIRDRKYVWTSFSRSGDSPEGVAVLDLAHRNYPDVHHLVISCNANGRMIRGNPGQSRALGICLDDAVNDRGLAMTSSFSNMVVFGQCLAHTEDIGKYEAILPHVVQAGRTLMRTAANCAAALAQEQYTKVCFVGSGALRAVAKESALKVLELTAGKTLTISESALGLRHGPMAALDKDTLFVCFLSGDRRVRRYELDLLEEVGRKKLVGARVVVAANDPPLKDSYAEHYVAPTSPIAVSDDYCGVVDVIFGQMLGLFFSLRWNLQPDHPSPNGAISRVVQNVKIHS